LQRQHEDGVYHSPNVVSYFRFWRHSGPCPDLPLANPVANEKYRTLYASEGIVSKRRTYQAGRSND
jgi:hypothetical protein